MGNKGTSRRKEEQKTEPIEGKWTGTKCLRATSGHVHGEGSCLFVYLFIAFVARSKIECFILIED